MRYNFIQIIKAITKSMTPNKKNASFTSSISKIVVLATMLVILINTMNSCSLSIQGFEKSLLLPINP